MNVMVARSFKYEPYRWHYVDVDCLHLFLMHIVSGLIVLDVIQLVRYFNV